MINVIVFSKDRACQLDLFLRSFLKRFKIDYELTILYAYIDDEFEEGYNIVRNLYPNIKFIKESNLRNDLIKLIDSDCKFVLNLSDDDFITSDIIEDDIFKTFDNDENNIVALSLIKSRNNKYVVDNSDELCGQPNWFPNNTWEWVKPQSHPIWNYGMSLTTNIYRTKDLLERVINLPFITLEDLEDMMMKHPINKSLQLGSSEIKMVNLIINIVNLNSYMTAEFYSSPVDLNDLWLAGKRIILLDNLRKDTYTFRRIELTFEDRV